MIWIALGGAANVSLAGVLLYLIFMRLRYDAPGYPTLDATQIAPGAFTENVYQIHAKEFLRVQFNGQRPDGDGVAGTRCSDYQEWWSQVSVVINGQGNITRTGAPHVSDIETSPVFATMGPPFAK